MKVTYVDELPLLPKLDEIIERAKNNNREIDHIELNTRETLKLVKEIAPGPFHGNWPLDSTYRGVKIKLNWSQL